MLLLFLHPRSFKTFGKHQGISQNGKHGIMPFLAVSLLSLFLCLVISPSYTDVPSPASETKQPGTISEHSPQWMCSEPKFSLKIVLWGKIKTQLSREGQEDGIKGLLGYRGALKEIQKLRKSTHITDHVESIAEVVSPACPNAHLHIQADLPVVPPPLPQTTPSDHHNTLSREEIFQWGVPSGVHSHKENHLGSQIRLQAQK